MLRSVTNCGYSTASSIPISCDRRPIARQSSTSEQQQRRSLRLVVRRSAWVRAASFPIGFCFDFGFSSFFDRGVQGNPSERFSFRILLWFCAFITCLDAVQASQVTRSGKLSRSWSSVQKKIAIRVGVPVIALVRVIFQINDYLSMKSNRDIMYDTFFRYNAMFFKGCSALIEQFLLIYMF